MGRPKKVVSQEEVGNKLVDVVVANEPVVAGKVDAPAVEEKKDKAVSYSLTASFKTRSMEGDRITHKYQGVGKSLDEAVSSVVGSDEDLVDEFNKPFPKGINLLVNVTLRTSAGHEFARALAPHVARDIFENKNVVLAAKLLGA